MEHVLAVDASKNTIEMIVIGLDPQSSRIASETISIIESVQFERNLEFTLAEELTTASKQLKSQWENAVLLLPGEGHLSMNVTLPFSDPKKVSKLIAAEVQDTVPIEMDQFTLDFTHVGSINGSGQDFHVGLYPIGSIATITSALKDTSIEPRIITTPASALGGLYEVFKTELESNALILYETSDWLYFTVIIGGKIVGDRAINLLHISITQSEGIIESAIRASEQRYETSIDIIYRVTDTTTTQRVSSIGSRTIKDLSMISLFPSAKERVSLPALVSSLFAREYPAPRILNNFRVGKFSFTPSFTSLKSGAKTLTPYLLLLLLAIAVAIVGWFAAREYTIESMRKQLTKVITADIPSFKSDAGSEAVTLQSMSKGLEDSLKELGSPLASPPLDVLSAVSEDLSSVEGATVGRISIRNGEVKIDGTAPSYSKLNRLEAAIKKRKAIFCRTKTDNSPGSSSGKEGLSFSMTITLCE